MYRLFSCLEVLLMSASIRTLHVLLVGPKRQLIKNNNQKIFSVILSDRLISLGARVKTKPHIDMMSNLR